MNDATKFSAKDAEALLTSWDEKLRVAEANVHEMRLLGAYRLITAHPRPTFTGRTQTELVPAMAALEELWQNFALLSDNVKLAHSIYDNLPTFGQDEKLKEIRRLLTGPSIKLPPIQVPLEQRGLLTPAETQQAITPERLLEVLLKAFDVAVKVVARVDTINNDHYQKLAAVQESIDQLNRRLTACRWLSLIHI